MKGDIKMKELNNMKKVEGYPIIDLITNFMLKKGFKLALCHDGSIYQYAVQLMRFEKPNQIIRISFNFGKGIENNYE